MSTNKTKKWTDRQAHFPSVEEIQNELATAKSIDNFFGKGAPEAVLPSHTRYYKGMDDAHPELGQHLEPISYPLCQPLFCPTNFHGTM